MGSGEFAASHAKEFWAQSMLGAVERLVLGVRAGARLCSLQSLTQQELVEAAQRADEDWRPEVTGGAPAGCDRIRAVVVVS